MSKASVWFKGLSNSGKVAVVTVAFLLTIGTVGTLAQSGSNSNSAPADTAATQKTESKPSPAPVVIQEAKQEAIPFAQETREDGTIAKGQTQIGQEGAEGERTITFEVTYLDDKEVSRKEVKNEITKAPVNKVTLVGTYVAPPPAPKPSCDPNYSGACVPIASDVDCASGSGNGPAYVAGPVTVIGSDIYGLDRDGNGTGCE